MRTVERFEYKYKLNIKDYHAFKNKLKIFMKHDFFTHGSNEKRYFIKSLYYDTYDYKHYKESEEGQYGRIKCRFRTYYHKLSESKQVLVEIKTKHGQNVRKYSEFITSEEYKYFLKHKYFNRSSKLLDEFTRLIHLGNLTPKVVISYEREGYSPKDGSDFRLTFDFDVRSAPSSQLFYNKKLIKRSHYHDVILEIKCGMKKPTWLEDLVKAYGLKTVKNSKYIQAITLSRPKIIGSKGI